MYTSTSAATTAGLSRTSARLLVRGVQGRHGVGLGGWHVAARQLQVGVEQRCQRKADDAAAPLGIRMRERQRFLRLRELFGCRQLPDRLIDRHGVRGLVV